MQGTAFFSPRAAVGRGARLTRAMAGGAGCCHLGAPPGVPSQRAGCLRGVHTDSLSDVSPGACSQACRRVRRKGCWLGAGREAHSSNQFQNVPLVTFPPHAIPLSPPDSLPRCHSSPAGPTGHAHYPFLTLSFLQSGH